MWSSSLHEDPEVRVINIVDIPGTRVHNRVDREFWVRVIARLRLLDSTQALCIEWSSDALAHVYSSCYYAASKAGISVTVQRVGNCTYVSRRSD